jgi:hypothetical protein
MTRSRTQRPLDRTEEGSDVHRSRIAAPPAPRSPPDAAPENPSRRRASNEATFLNMLALHRLGLPRQKFQTSPSGPDYLFIQRRD